MDLSVLQNCLQNSAPIGIYQHLLVRLQQPFLLTTWTPVPSDPLTRSPRRSYRQAGKSTSKLYPSFTPTTISRLRHLTQRLPVVENPRLPGRQRTQQPDTSRPPHPPGRSSRSYATFASFSLAVPMRQIWRSPSKGREMRPIFQHCCMSAGFLKHMLGFGATPAWSRRRIPRTYTTTIGASAWVTSKGDDAYDRCWRSSARLVRKDGRVHFGESDHSARALAFVWSVM